MYSCMSQLSSGLQITNCSTLSNWCTRKMPHVSFPCAPASLRKFVEKPVYFSGRSFSSSHSPMWYPQIGCSDVAIRYFSSPSSPVTWYSSSSKSSSCATPAITSLFMKYGVCSVVNPRWLFQCIAYMIIAWFSSTALPFKK